MPTIKLEGMPERVVKEFAHSVAGYIRLLKRDGFSTGAGDNGAISLWKTKDGNYRAYRSVHWIERDSIVTKKMSEVKTWLKTNVPMLN